MGIKNEKNYITLDDSMLLYGAAILLIVFHHCFCIPLRLNYHYYPCLFGFEIEARIAYIGKLGVGIFAFISGYALSQKKNPYTGLFLHCLYDIKTSICSYVKLCSKLWVVCAIFLPIGILFYEKTASFAAILKALFLGRGYNGEWWYVFQYIKFLAVFPVVDTFVNCITQKRKQDAVLLSAGIAFSAILLLFSQGMIRHSFYQLVSFFASPYMYLFILAYLIGKYKVFECLSGSVHIPLLINFVLIVMLILFRWFLIFDPADGSLDVILSPIFVYCLLQLTHRCNSENTMIHLLKLLGKYSTFMWLVHTFWIYYYFQEIITLPRYSLLIYLWAVVISLVNAVALDLIYRQSGIEKAAKKISAWILNLGHRITIG